VDAELARNGIAGAAQAEPGLRQAIYLNHGWLSTTCLTTMEELAEKHYNKLLQSGFMVAWVLCWAC
jgi:hypothetical protein